MSPLALACAVAFSSVPARGEEGAVEAVVNSAAAETCVAVFTVMAYAYADDDVKEQLLEEKKVLARADIRPQQEVVSAEAQASQPQSSEDRIQHIMDVLTEMMLSEPTKAQGIAQECFHQYPPEIELN